MPITRAEGGVMVARVNLTVWWNSEGRRKTAVFDGFRRILIRSRTRGVAPVSCFPGPRLSAFPNRIASLISFRSHQPHLRQAALPGREQRTSRRIGHRRGMTLIEVLVAVALPQPAFSRSIHFAADRRHVLEYHEPAADARPQGGERERDSALIVRQYCASRS